MDKKRIFMALSCAVVTTSMCFSGISIASAAKINAMKLYAKHCDACHDKNGKPTDFGKELETTDFTDKNWQAKVTDEEIVAQISDGTPEKMVSYKETLSQDEIKALVPVIRSFGRK